MDIQELQTNVDHEKVEHAAKTKKIIEYIGDGLSEDDAITLAGYNIFEYEEMKKKYPRASEEIHKAVLSFKHAILKPITAAASNGDQKLGQWILEKRFGDEFNQKARQPQTDGETQTDLLVAAIRDIQQNGTTTTLIGLKRTTKKIMKELPINLKSA